MTAYSFLDTNVTFTSTDNIPFNLGQGTLVAEEGIDITPEGDRNIRTMGADGGGIHSLKKSTARNFSISFLKNSPLNQILTQLYNAQSVDPYLWGGNTVVIEHKSSNDTHTLSRVAFKKLPDMKYATEADIIKWEFECIASESVLGNYGVF